MTQSKIILNVLNESRGEWFFGYSLIKMNTRFGFLGSSADRRARELAEAGEIEVKYEGRYAKYRYPVKEQLTLV